MAIKASISDSKVAIAVPPSTLAKDDEITLKTAGQRKISLIWELVQGTIALLSVGSGLFIMIHNELYGEGMQDLPASLSSMIFLIIGFYFARTNHEKIGGVGSKGAINDYEGR